MKIEDFLLFFNELLDGSNFAHRTFLVGGVVRDLHLGQTDFEDFDLTVQKRFGGLSLAKYLSNKDVCESCEIFEKFGTARLVLQGIKVDLAETRREIYHKGRRYPQIRYAPIEEDVWRRDFTINALYMNIKSKAVTDPSEMGFRDLDKHIIRTLREPSRVFSEDALRLLRAVRFAATLGFELEQGTADAIREAAPLCKRLSQRAWQMEMDKLKASAAWEQGLFLLKHFGLLSYAPPSIAAEYFPQL